MDLYKEYIKEREGADLIQHHHGFLTYKKDYDGIFVLDVYVKNWWRKQGIAKKMLEEALEKTQAKKAYTTTDTKAKGWEEAEKAILRVGFKKLTSIGTLNYYKMEIE